MKPKRIFLIRHGQSEGNVDKSIYTTKPDYAVMLTKKGIAQALVAGKKIKDLIGEENYCTYYSPYFRARHTMDCAVKNLKSNPCQFKREEPRIREQEYCGRLRTDYIKHEFDKEREKYGKFFYRMDGGESGADIWDRVSDLIGTLHRDFEKKDYPQNVLIFGHGMSNRIFLMRFFKFTVEEFEMWKNPDNGEIYVLELQDNNKYKLMSKIEKHAVGYGHKYEIRPR